MWNLKYKINEKKKQKQTHRYREQTDGYQRGGGLRDWVKQAKKLRSTNWQLQNSHGDVKYSIENIAKNIVISMYGTRWVLKISGGTPYKLYDCLTTMLYTNTK